MTTPELPWQGASLESFLHEQIAQDRVRQTLIRYCVCLDEYDIDGVADCFTEDATADYGPGRGGALRGRGPIARRIAQGQADFRRTHHQLGQMQVTVDGHRASALSYLTAWHERSSGVREVLCLRYRDQLRLDGGTWRIDQRLVEMAWADGFDGVAWRWVERKPSSAW